jgi:hypothetical protein
MAGFGVAASATAAVADDISNNLDGTVDPVAELMALNVGGPVGTTQMYVIPRNGDGKNGCNLTGGKTLTVSVSSANTSVATVSPSSLTFTSCGDSLPVTVTPVAVGSTNVNVAQTGNTTGGTFDLTKATFTVTVAPPPNTAPSVAISGVTGGASYPKGSVPVAMCDVTDAEDGNSSFPATLSALTGPYAADGIGQQTASCSYTDGGGLTASASVTYSIFDPTPPVVSHTLAPTAPDGANGWYVSNVSLLWGVLEPESPSSLVTTGCVNQTITADQTAQTYSCSATSAGGGPASDSVTIQRDATAPTGVTFVGGPVDGGVYFPNNVPAVGSCTASDATSGLDGCVVTGYSTALGSHTLTATATDVAGNTAAATLTYLVRKLDLYGFYQPVDMGGVLNTTTNGSTVPLKFRVFDQGVQQTSTAVVKSFTQQKISCTGGSEDPIEELASTGGTTLRYDSTGGQFIQNWKTPTGAGTCYRVTLTTVDDSSLTALFKLK